MKTILATAAASLVFAAPAFAQSAAELFAMSNSSAAETIVREGSMGNVTAARLRLALGNMSAAERQAFFEADTVGKQKILEAQEFFDNSDSAAEMAAELENISRGN
ncbi:hypothetical protein C8N43_1160 [Litoreibacter ponti]|uniref:Uncharacterized protein n=1 Tax=Litoreibacter ponti TaxID=1510457 RepID=A0A2T6BKB6_9RHOB|nr:hypothetical protein [Litoreibacter ponti]PTX56501.1 hypothetical protein C8N43_1160 [Litoreibacter ponti]